MQAHRTCSTAGNATGERRVPLTPDEIDQFRVQAQSIISSVGDELYHVDKHTLEDVERTVSKLEIGVRMLRDVERGVFVVDADTLAILEGEREYLARDTAEEEQTQADLDKRGLAALAERHDESYRTKMSLAEVLEDVASSRKQLERDKRELAIYAGFLNGWEDRATS